MIFMYPAALLLFSSACVALLYVLITYRQDRKFPNILRHSSTCKHQVLRFAQHDKQEGVQLLSLTISKCLQSVVIFACHAEVRSTWFRQ